MIRRICGLMDAAPRKRSSIGVLSPRPKTTVMRASITAEWSDPVVDAYKRDVDRTLLRENLKLSPEERLRKLQDFVRFLSEVRAAGKKAGTGR
jgi:hypothetical protein